MAMIEKAKPLRGKFGADLILQVGAGASSDTVTSKQLKLDNVKYITTYVVDSTSTNGISTTTFVSLYGLKREGVSVLLFSGYGSDWVNAGRQTFDTSEYIAIYITGKNTQYYCSGLVHCFIGTLSDAASPIPHQTNSNKNIVSQITTVDISNTTFEYTNVSGGTLGKNGSQLYLTSNQGKTVNGTFTSNNYFYIDFDRINFASTSIANTSSGTTHYAKGTFALVDEDGVETKIYSNFTALNGFNCTKIIDLNSLGLKSGYYKIRFIMTGATHTTGYPADVTYFSFVNTGIMFM